LKYVFTTQKSITPFVMTGAYVLVCVALFKQDNAFN